jgi:hypothetical protein
MIGEPQSRRRAAVVARRMLAGAFTGELDPQIVTDLQENWIIGARFTGELDPRIVRYSKENFDPEFGWQRRTN